MSFNQLATIAIENKDLRLCMVFDHGDEDTGPLGLFAADRKASLVVSPPFAFMIGDPKLVGLEFAEVAGVVVLELWGYP